MPQVREAIGVTLSVLCSNIRLYSSFAHNNSHEGLDSDVDSKVKGESWVQVLTEQASELVINIQKTGQSDNLEAPTDMVHENGLSNGNSQDDIKWMETVLTTMFFLTEFCNYNYDLLLMNSFSLIYVVIAFYYLISEVWKIFIFAGYNSGSSLSCNCLTGMYYEF